MRPKDSKTKTQYRKEIAAHRGERYSSMENGPKKPSERAREWFRRPAYGSFAGRVERNCENLNGVNTCSNGRSTNNGREKA